VDEVEDHGVEGILFLACRENKKVQDAIIGQDITMKINHIIILSAVLALGNFSGHAEILSGAFSVCATNVTSLVTTFRCSQQPLVGTVPVVQHTTNGPAFLQFHFYQTDDKQLDKLALFSACNGRMVRIMDGENVVAEGKFCEVLTPGQDTNDYGLTLAFDSVEAANITADKIAQLTKKLHGSFLIASRPTCLR
jgi:hypothetical protein